MARPVSFVTVKVVHCHGDTLPQSFKSRKKLHFGMLSEAYNLSVSDQRSIRPGGQHTFLFHTKFVLNLVKDVAALIFRPKENVIDIASW